MEKLERNLVIAIRVGFSDSSTNFRAFRATNNIAKNLGHCGFEYDPKTNWSIRLRLAQIDAARLQIKAMGGSDTLVAAMDWRPAIDRLLELECRQSA